MQKFIPEKMVVTSEVEFIQISKYGRQTANSHISRLGLYRDQFQRLCPWFRGSPASADSALCPPTSIDAGNSRPATQGDGRQAGGTCSCISRSRLYRDAVPMVITHVYGVAQFNELSADIGRCQKHKMVADKPKVIVSHVQNKIETQFQRHCPCF